MACSACKTIGISFSLTPNLKKERERKSYYVHLLTVWLPLQSNGIGSLTSAVRR